MSNEFKRIVFSTWSTVQRFYAFLYTLFSTRHSAKRIFFPGASNSGTITISHLRVSAVTSIALFLLLISSSVSAQTTTYPIRTYTVLNPPMPYSLSAFASEPGRMQLNVVVDDVALDQYPVKFSLHIQGNGVHLYTKPDLQQLPFMLDGGLTETVTGLDLEPLFNPNNLIFEGYSRKEYQRNGRLPEGVYRIWVDILDYYRGMKVSQAFPGMAMIYLTRAPRLSFPLDKAEVNPQTEPNIRFSWMGTLPTDPEADVYYRLNLWEIMPEGRDPYEVARVSSPIFTDESDDPNFLYDMGMPPLMDGMSYAWQVQAMDRENRARFQNEGYSEVNSFRYGLSCVTPEPRINSVAYTEASISWPANAATQLYRVFYKKAKDTEWQSEETTMVNHTLRGLEDNTDYEIKVVAICGNEESDESRIIRLKTDRNVDYTCGTGNDDFDLSNREPLEALHPFDEFKAADFVIEVTEAEGSNGVFSGKGMALVPYIGMVKFYVTFDNITINTDNRMVDGEVHFVYDEATGMVVAIGAGGGDDDEEVDVTDDLDDIADEVITIDGDVKEVKVSDDKVVVVKEDGTTETIKIKEGDKVAVVSNGGQVHVADSGSGRVYTTPKKKSGGKKGSDSVGTASQTRQYGASVSFKAPDDMHFGYDPVGDGKTKPNAYFRTNKTGDRIAWKSIQAGGTDYIDVIPQGTHADSLRYIRESGLVTPTAPQDNGSRLLLTGLGGGDEDILTVAVAKTEQIDSANTREILTEAGALGLVSYDVITKNVVLVPVNRAQCPQNKVVVQEYLNKLYKGAVVNWNVEIGQPFDFTDYTGESFKTEGSALLSKYTHDMNRLIDAYKKQASNFSKDNYYLFFINEPQTNKLGFMPLTGQFGFIFNFGHTLSTVGHELAHGAFNLRHTFSKRARYNFQPGFTKNLLDYSNSEELWKYQWDLIHNPETILLGFMQNEDEGAAFRVAGTDMQTICDETVLDIINQKQIYYTPDLQKIDLSKITGAKANRFYTIKDATAEAQGTLNGFEKDGKQYVMVYGDTSKRVKKFKHKEGDEIPIEQLLYKGSSEPELVYVDCDNSKVWLNSNDTKYDFECVDCKTSDIPCAGLLKKYENTPIMRPGVLRTAILKDPCILENPFVPNGEGLGYETEFMKGLNAMVGAGLSVAFSPVILEFIIIPSLEAAIPQATNVAAGVTTEELSRRGVQAAIGVTVDATMQAAFAYYFDLEDNERTWENAIRSIDPWQAGASGVEAAFDKVWLEMASSCILDATFENGELTGSFDSYDCLKGTLSAALAQGAFKGAGIAFKKLKTLAKNNPIKFKQGLERLGITKDKWDEVIRRFVKSSDSVVSSVIKKFDNLGLPNLKSKFEQLDKEAKERFAHDISGLNDDLLQELEDNFGLVDVWKKVDALDDAAKKSKKPEWLKNIQKGNDFNNIRKSAYDYNEVYLVNPKDANRKVILDSYIPDEEIVSRKFTQLADINESTGLKYLEELKNKYPPGTKIAKVKSNQDGGYNGDLEDLIGEGINGKMILEVPVQKGKVPQTILDFAKSEGITIRDILGKEYK